MGISIVFARGLMSELRDRGLNPDELLRRSNIRSERLVDLRETMTIEEVELLVRTATEMTNDPGLGLSIGENAPENMLQVFGHLLLSQRTIREAFAILQRFSALVVEGPTFSLVEQHEFALFTWMPSSQRGDTTRFLMDLTLATTARIASHFFTEGQGLHEVRFVHQRPSYADRYQRVFGCPVHFGQSTNALVAPRALLDATQLHADQTVRMVMGEAAERLLQERTQGRSVTERVRTQLRYERDLTQIRLDQVARKLGISPRSLRRRLGSEGTQLSALIDEARCRIACAELRRPDSTIKAAAQLLGFSEPSAFHRAFKRWTGRTPAEYIRGGDQEWPTSS